MKDKVKGKVSLDELRGRISIQEMGMVECCLIKYEQKKEFGVLVEALEKGNKYTKHVCPLAVKKLDPFVCNGILCVRGQLNRAQLDKSIKHPIILPSESWFTCLVTHRYHKLVGHGGISHTFTSLRERFWVLKKSCVVRSVLAKCWSCRRRNALLGEQKMADLPEA